MSRPENYMERLSFDVFQFLLSFLPPIPYLFQYQRVNKHWKDCCLDCLKEDIRELYWDEEAISELKFYHSLPQAFEKREDQELYEALTSSNYNLNLSIKNLKSFLLFRKVINYFSRLDTLIMRRNDDFGIHWFYLLFVERSDLVIRHLKFVKCNINLSGLPVEFTYVNSDKLYKMQTCFSNNEESSENNTAMGSLSEKNNVEVILIDPTVAMTHFKNNHYLDNYTKDHLNKLVQLKNNLVTEFKEKTKDSKLSKITLFDTRSTMNLLPMYTEFSTVILMGSLFKNLKQFENYTLQPRNYYYQYVGLQNFDTTSKETVKIFKEKLPSIQFKFISPLTTVDEMTKDGIDSVEILKFCFDLLTDLCQFRKNRCDAAMKLFYQTDESRKSFITNIDKFFYFFLVTSTFGIDTKLKDTLGYTILHHALISEQSFSIVEFIIYYTVSLELLLDGEKGKLNATYQLNEMFGSVSSFDGRHPIQMSFENKSKQTIEKFISLYLQFGVSLNHRLSNGQTVLHYICRIGKNFVIDHIFKSCNNLSKDEKKDFVDFNIQDDDGNTCVHVAALLRMGNLVKLFKENENKFGIDFNIKNKEGLTVDDCLQKEREIYKPPSIAKSNPPESKVKGNSFFCNLM
ncbi:hypothetical protein ABK040_009425 [Willaertia magna]